MLGTKIRIASQRHRQAQAEKTRRLETLGVACLERTADAGQLVANPCARAGIGADSVDRIATHSGAHDQGFADQPLQFPESRAGVALQIEPGRNGRAEQRVDGVVNAMLALEFRAQRQLRPSR